MNRLPLLIDCFMLIIDSAVAAAAAWFVEIGIREHLERCRTFCCSHFLDSEYKSKTVVSAVAVAYPLLNNVINATRPLLVLNYRSIISVYLCHVQHCTCTLYQ